MKKTLLSGLLLFVAAMTLFNCSKDETTDPTVRGNQLRAAVEEPTRTSLDGTIVTWALKDKIKVVNQNAPARAVEYTLTEGGGTGNGIFTATAPLNNGAKWAFYPSSAFGSCADNAFTFTLPATQEYHATSFANEAYPMVAQSATDGTLAFKNLCGIIKLQLTGNQTVASIQLETAGEQIAGPATVAMNYTTAPTLACDAQLGTTTVTLQNINSLLSDTPTSFFFVVPAGEYAAGLTFTALDDKGAVIYTKTTAKTLTVIRSEVAALTPISTLHFPDPVFRAELKAQGYALTTDQTDIDVNNPDNKKLFANTTKLEVQQKKIATLQGIEYFTALTYLNCYQNQLTSLDVTKNTKLTILRCNENQLTSLDLSQNTALTVLRCNDNQLTSLDLSKNTALTYINCGYNKLPSLDVSQNTALTLLGCYNNRLPSLNINTCLMLTKLACGNQHTDGGTGETYTKLQLTCSESQKALITMPDDAAYNKNVIFERIIAFPDPKFRAALVATCKVKLTTDQTDIDVNNADNKKLFANRTELNVSCKDIKTLQGIEYFTALTYLICYENQLTSLDLSQNTALTRLVCRTNQLTSLDFTKNTALTVLNCGSNQLTSLDLSKNTALTLLNCCRNPLTNLDVSKNTALTYLDCHFDQLTSLDIQPLTSLIDFWCGQQLAGGAVEPNYSELILYMTQTQFDKNLGTGYYNYNVTRVPCGW